MQDFNDKINQVYQSIFSETKKRLDLLLSLCESPIEKLFLINIFAHYYYLSLGLVKMEFITRALTTHEQSEDNLLKGQYNEEITDWPYLIQGLRIGGIHTPKVMPIKEFIQHLGNKKTDEAKPVYTFNIYPQYNIVVNDRHFKMDFAIIIEKKLKDESTKEIFCIECDGHEYHKTKEQRAYDNERMRILLKNEIKTLRYTGTEIANFDRDKVIDFDNILFKNITGTDSLIFLLKNF